jgi:hypothetical protein
MSSVYDLSEWLYICNTYTFALAISAQNAIDYHGR